MALLRQNRHVRALISRKLLAIAIISLNQDHYVAGYLCQNVSKSPEVQIQRALVDTAPSTKRDASNLDALSQLTIRLRVEN